MAYSLASIPFEDMTVYRHDFAYIEAEDSVDSPIEGYSAYR
jgi:hypothetical protein